MASRARTRNLKELLDAYEKDHDPPYEMRQVVEWAVQNGLWDTPSLESLLEAEMNRRAGELSDFARKERHTDPDGVSVRSYYATKTQEVDGSGKVVQSSLWSSRDRASFEFKTQAISQRYRGVVGDKTQLERDVQSINKHDRPKGMPRIALNWDLRHVSEDGDEKGKTA